MVWNHHGHNHHNEVPMFHIIERREVAHRIYLEGWQHHTDDSIRYFRNDRHGFRDLPRAVSPDAIVRLYATVNREFAEAVADYEGRFVPAATIERIINDAEAPPGVHPHHFKREDDLWAWTVWLHNEVQPLHQGKESSRELAVLAADKSLGKVLGLQINDEPPIPWSLTDRIHDLEVALTPIMDQIARQGGHLRLGEEDIKRIQQVMADRKPFHELKIAVLG
jgi:hypothetical protein